MDINTIIHAIKERKKVKFSYRAKDRIVDPHIFGISTKGEEVILGWQTAGNTSKTGDLPNWRMFKIREVYDLQITIDNFIPQVWHRKPDINTVYATVW